MNAAFRSRLGSSLLALLGLNLTIPCANAQGVSTTPEGYQPGWEITVRKAGGGLAPTPGRPLAEFAAPAAGFDLGSYRGAVDDPFTFGLVYDATGLLNVGAKGRQKLTAKASWDAEYRGVAEALCALSLALEGTKATQWTGTVGSAAGEQSVEVDADLDQGLRKANLRAACDRPLGPRFRIDLAFQAPGDSAPRPLGPIEMVHAAPATPVPAGQGEVAMRDPPPVHLEPTPPPPVPRPAPAPAGEVAAQGRQALVAIADIRVRAAPRPNAPTLGLLFAGQQVTVAGLTPDSAWYRLARGGYAAAGFLKPPGSAGPPRPVGR